MTNFVKKNNFLNERLNFKGSKPNSQMMYLLLLQLLPLMCLY